MPGSPSRPNSLSGPCAAAAARAPRSQKRQTRQSVTVRWQPGTDRAEAPGETQAMLARYAAAIAAAGWHVTTAGHEVTVTAGRADPWE